MTDIRLMCGFHDHPKTIKLVRKVGYEGAFCLTKLWCWAAINKPKGDLSGLDADDIEIAAGWNGEAGKFFDALMGVWIDEEFKLHDWQDHQSWVCGAPERSAAAKKAADKRWAKTSQSGDSANRNAKGMRGASDEQSSRNAGSMPPACGGQSSRNAPLLSSPNPNHITPVVPFEDRITHLAKIYREVRYFKSGDGGLEQARNLIQSALKAGITLETLEKETMVGAAHFQTKDDLTAHIRKLAPAKPKNPVKVHQLKIPKHPSLMTKDELDPTGCWLGDDEWHTEAWRADKVKEWERKYREAWEKETGLDYEKEFGNAG